MKRWHLYKEYVKTKAGKEGLVYQALFCTDENGIYVRHIDIVYSEFFHDIIKYIDNSSYFTFQYKRSQIEYVTSERNILKKIEMIEDIPEEATKVKTIYKLHQDIATEEGVYEKYVGNNLALSIASNTKNIFEGYNNKKINYNGEAVIKYLAPNKFINIYSVSDMNTPELLYILDTSMFSSYDIFVVTHKEHNIINEKQTIINCFIINILNLLKFRKISCSYISETKEFTVEKDLKKILDNLELFAMDNFEENNINVDDFDMKKIIKFAIEVGKAKQKDKQNIKAENNLHRIFKQKAEKTSIEDLLHI